VFPESLVAIAIRNISSSVCCTGKRVVGSVESGGNSAEGVGHTEGDGFMPQYQVWEEVA